MSITDPAQPAVQWRIYYGDGSTFDSNDGPPEQAPGLNVQAIAQASELAGRHIVSGSDYYIRHGGEWIGVDLFGLLDHLIAAGTVKAGRQLGMAEFRAVFARAVEDPGMPRKSAGLRGEREP